MRGGSESWPRFARCTVPHMKLSEVMQATGLSRSQVIRLRREGRLGAVRVDDQGNPCRHDLTGEPCRCDWRFHEVDVRAIGYVGTAGVGGQRARPLPPELGGRTAPAGRHRAWPAHERPRLSDDDHGTWADEGEDDGSETSIPGTWGGPIAVALISAGLIIATYALMQARRHRTA
jgi:hypothetical protein